MGPVYALKLVPLRQAVAEVAPVPVREDADGRGSGRVIGSRLHDQRLIDEAAGPKVFAIQQPTTIAAQMADLTARMRASQDADAVL